MEFTEEDAVAFATFSEARKAQVREAYRLLEERSEHLRHQRELLVQQNAVLHQDIDTFKDKLASMGIKKLPMMKVAGADIRKHVCTCAPLDPALWRTLPLDLLQLVFARLPLGEILRLRFLSKTWDRYVTGVTPGFTKVCAEANPSIFGMLPPVRVFHGQAALGRPTLYDIKSNRWHRFSYITMMEEKTETMLAGDGGLVCVVSTAKDKQRFPLSITVFNPLTMRWRELPPHALSSVHPRMIQLVMDRESKSYKVIVVGPKDERGGGIVGAIVFSSVTGTWSSPKAFTDLIFGFQYTWNQDPSASVDVVPWATEGGPCAYDCGNDTLLELGGLGDGDSPAKYPWNAADTHCYAFVKGRLFVLHEEWYVFGTHCAGQVEEKKRYCISEYRAQSCQPHWIKTRLHQCSDELEDPPCYNMGLYAWEGFLLVTADNEEVNGFAHVPAWLYDLSTGKWQAISMFPQQKSEDYGAMFELQWDAAP